MEVAAAVSRMPGLKLDGPIDAAAVAARRDDFVGHYQDGPEVSWVQSVPAAFVRGEGRLAGRLRVEVSTPEGGGRKLEARHAVVLATGTDRAIPGPARTRRGTPVDEPGGNQRHPRSQTAGRDRRRAGGL
jgi:dihydrolipoamide dehydrogenase